MGVGMRVATEGRLGGWRGRGRGQGQASLRACERAPPSLLSALDDLGFPSSSRTVRDFAAS